MRCQRRIRRMGEAALADAREQSRPAARARRAQARRQGAGRARRRTACPTLSATSRPTTSSARRTSSIEETADRILAEIGIEFRGDPAALELWKAAGADVDGELVRFEPGMLREILKSAPAASPSTRAIPPRSSRSAATASSSRRPTARPSSWISTRAAATARIEDFRNFIKLAHRAPGCTIPAAPSASRSTCR